MSARPMDKVCEDLTQAAPAPTYSGVRHVRYCDPYVSCCVAATNRPSFDRIDVQTVITSGSYRFPEEILDADNPQMVVQLPYRTPKQVDLTLTRLSQMEISNGLPIGHLTDAFNAWQSGEGAVNVLLERLLGLVFGVDYWRKTNRRTGQMFVCTYQVEAIKGDITDDMRVTGDVWRGDNAAKLFNRRYVAEGVDPRRVVYVDDRQRPGHHEEKHAAMEERGYVLKTCRLEDGDYACNRAPGVVVDTKSGIQELCENLCYPGVDRFEEAVKRAADKGLKLIILTVAPGCYFDTDIANAIRGYQDLRCAHCGYCRGDVVDNGCAKNPGKPKGANGETALRSMTSLLKDYPDTLKFVFSPTEESAGVCIVDIFRRAERGEMGGDGNVR